MKRSKFTDEQILAIVKEGEAGRKVADLSRTYGITEETYYRWKAKYGGMELSEMQRLKQVEDENRRLKHIGAEQTLDIQASGGYGAMVTEMVVGIMALIEGVRGYPQRRGRSSTMTEVEFPLLNPFGRGTKGGWPASLATDGSSQAGPRSSRGASRVGESHEGPVQP